MKTLFIHCKTKMRNRAKKGNEKTEAPVFTGIKMDRALYRKARQRAKQLHQDYSNYVRQLIVRDVEPEATDLNRLRSQHAEAA